VSPAFVSPAFVSPAFVSPAFVSPAFVSPAFVSPAQRGRAGGDDLPDRGVTVDPPHALLKGPSVS
jgi:hypothetical protein